MKCEELMKLQELEKRIDKLETIIYNPLYPPRCPCPTQPQPLHTTVTYGDSTK